MVHKARSRVTKHGISQERLVIFLVDFKMENQALLSYMVFVLFLVAIYAMHSIELIIVNDLSNETPTEEGLNNMW